MPRTRNGSFAGRGTIGSVDFGGGSIRSRCLLDEGGPAVDFVRKSFGDDVADRLVMRHMYGVG